MPDSLVAHGLLKGNTMAHRRLITPCFLIALLASACTGAPGANGSDDDNGGGNVTDVETQDGDDDGLSTDRDLCPGTAAGVAVDGNGCSEEQREESEKAKESGAAAEPTSGDIGEWKSSDDGSVSSNGFATFVLDPQGAFPVVLRTLEQNVTRRELGFDLKGTVLVDVPGGEPITLLEAEVALDYGSDQAAGLQSFRGAVRLPFPNIGFAADSSVKDPIHAAVGYDYGRNVSDVEVPLDENRKYFYFTFSAGLEAEIGDLDVSTPVNQSATMALDPSDPAFFLRASLGGLMGPVDEASVGFSIGGHLQFEPENTWGIDAEAASFEGHFWIGGKVNLNAIKLPVAIGGNTVYDFDPNDDGISFFEQPEDGFQFGTNAELDLSVEAGLVVLEIPIATSTLVGRAGENGADAYFSGMARGGNDWMPAELPLVNTAQLKVAGRASSDVAESYLHAEGALSFDAGKLGDWTGLDLNDLAMASANLDIDKSGVLVHGTVNADFSPYLGLSGDVSAEGFFTGNPEDWFLALEGRLAVSGIDLSSNASAVLNHEGMFVQGVFSTPLAAIDMSGKITAQGVDLRGHGEVTIPIVAGKEELQWITDQAVCGTEIVTDAAVCGAQTVADGAVCGWDYVTSGTLCGWDYVQDGARCGWTYAQDGAQCGFDHVTSGVLCGWDYFSDIWHCGSCLWGDCSCSVEASCDVARSCSFEASCSVEASCNVPRTCEIPNTCERVKTCETKVVIPDFDYGTFHGTVDVAIGTSGLGGGVQGEYCVTADSCVPLGGGRVQVINGRTEACVTVPGLGEFCGGF